MNNKLLLRWNFFDGAERKNEQIIKIFCLIFVMSNKLYICDCGTLPVSQLAEQTLISTLLNGYNKNIRPSEQVSVDMTASIKQLLSIDEKQQIMTSSLFLSQTWYDNRLSWTPNASNNIEVVMLPVKSLWIPDTMILNSADINAYLTINNYSLASIDFEGQVYMILPALTIRTRCEVFVRKFPLDKQICNINLTSWSQGSNRILYTENGSFAINIDEYVEHSLWKLEKTNILVTEAEDRSPFEYTENAVISIQLYFQRKPLFFMINGIFACFILNCVTLLAFSLPFATQITLSMLCFTTYSVYSLHFSNLFPQQSEYLMMITLYFLSSISWTFISMIWFIICNHYITKGQMPKSLYTLSKFLQIVFFCCFSSSKTEDNTDKKMDAIVEDGQFNQFIDRNNLQVITNQNRQIVSGQNLYLSRMQRPMELENTYRIMEHPLDRIESIQTNENTTSKCKFCKRCKSCQADFDKDKAKEKKKKDIESKCSALNYFILLSLSIFILISNIVLWILMSK